MGLPGAGFTISSSYDFWVRLLIMTFLSRTSRLFFPVKLSFEDAMTL